MLNAVHLFYTTVTLHKINNKCSETPNFGKCPPVRESTYCSVDSLGISSSFCPPGDSLGTSICALDDSLGISSSLCGLGDSLGISICALGDSLGISSSLWALDDLNVDETGVDVSGFKPTSLGLGLCTDLPAVKNTRQTSIWSNR